MLDTVITSTLAGSFVCLMLLLFKNRLLKLLGGKTLYRINLFAMLIFVIPFNMISFHLPQFTNQPLHTETVTVEENPQTQQTTQPAQNNTVQEQEINEVQPAAVLNLPNMARSENPITLQELLIAIWLLGFVISMSRYFISYRRFKGQICGFEECERINGVRVIKSPIIASPMIFGFFKPTLAIPEIEMETEDYELAIKHEMIHLEAHDSWLKLFAVIVNSVCWFNPITYFMVNLIGETCEYACDEQVTKEMDTLNKQKYSEMILTMVCQSSPALSSNMAKNKKQLKRRFEMIMKKKNTSKIQKVLCGVLILALFSTSVVFANEAAPLLSSFLKEDYVYISSFGKGDDQINVPVKKDGVYYLPLRNFLNNCDIENDKIMYDDGKITVDVWSYDMTGFKGDEQVELPGVLVWKTSCTIGSTEVDIDGKKYTLNNAPYLEGQTTYVPYEYIKLLVYSERMQEIIVMGENNVNINTAKFYPVMLYGYDSMESKYYTDYIQLSRVYKDYNSKIKGLFDGSWQNTTSATAEISKTGYRTKCRIKSGFTKIGNPNRIVDLEIILNKATRIYGKGSDIEGLFTVKVDGYTVYNNEIGYINNLPIKAGEGIAGMGRTTVSVGELITEMFFSGFGLNTTAEYSVKSTENHEIEELQDTVKLAVLPNEVKLNGLPVINGSHYSMLFYNEKSKYSMLKAYFDNHKNDDDYFDTYTILQGADCEAHFIDKHTFSAHFQLERNGVRIDSFDAIVSVLPDNRFELKSNCGKYVIRGTTSPFVPAWEWTEQQKQAPRPFVKMINE